MKLHFELRVYHFFTNYRKIKFSPRESVLHQEEHCRVYVQWNRKPQTFPPMETSSQQMNQLL